MYARTSDVIDFRRSNVEQKPLVSKPFIFNTDFLVSIHRKVEAVNRSVYPDTEIARVQTYLYNIVIKQQPEAMTFHYSDVMTTIWTTEIETNLKAVRLYEQSHVVQSTLISQGQR